MPKIRLLLPVIALSVAMVAVLPGPACAILQKGQPAPLFALKSTAGQQVSVNNLRGNVLVLEFFATWCAPCRESIPFLNGMIRKYGKQGLQVVGMNVDDNSDENDLKEFAAARKMSYPVVTANEDLQADYGLRSVPTTYVINKKGVVIEKYMGFNDQMSVNMEALIKKLLAE